MKMPKIGFGTWQLQEGDEAYSSVTTALKAGYRLIDTAKIYGNESSVGSAIRDSKIAREEIILTTKLWPSDFDEAEHAFNESLQRLGLDFVDLYLIHWPGSEADARRKAWKILEKLKAAGKVKYIGVSNYETDHLEELAAYAKEKPYANQIEFHPFIYAKQKPVLDYCKKHGILVEAYSPLAQAGKLNDPILAKIADQHGVESAQVMLRWAIQQGTIPIPRSSNPGRIKQNFDIENFELSDHQLKLINGLSSGKSALG